MLNSTFLYNLFGFPLKQTLEQIFYIKMQLILKKSIIYLKIMNNFFVQPKQEQ